MIEKGARWINVLARSTPISTKFYALILVRRIIDDGLLPSYAHTDDERAFFVTNNVTTAAYPLFRADLLGYNSGNELLGLLAPSCMIEILISFCSCAPATQWRIVEMECVAGALCAKLCSVPRSL